MKIVRGKPGDSVESSSSDVTQLKRAPYRCLLVMPVTTVTHDISFPEMQKHCHWFFLAASDLPKEVRAIFIHPDTFCVTISLSLSQADGGKGESHIIHRIPKACKWAGMRPNGVITVKTWFDWWTEELNRLANMSLSLLLCLSSPAYLSLSVTGQYFLST